MAIVVSDNFNKPDNPTSLGTASTGQTWSQVAGAVGAFGISSNQALWTWNPTDPATSIAVIESGLDGGTTQLKLVDPTASPNLFGVGMGLVFRYVDLNFYWYLIYQKFPGPTNHLRLRRVYAGGATSVIDTVVTLADNDVLSVNYCGADFEIFVNGVSQGTYNDSLNPQNYGTQCGIITSSGTYFAALTRHFEDFLVTTFGTCTPTYNCTGAGCVDPGDGSGTYATLEACLAACSISPSYNCVDGTCVDPGDGTGTFATLLECQQSGCANLQAETRKFDAGNGSSYYVVAQLDDDGNELRSKTYKAIRATGIRTNASAMMYGYDVQQEIDVDDLETGTRSNTRMATQPQEFADSIGVTQSERKPINVTNAVLGTIRYEGDDTGNVQRDRIDEIVIERAIQGVRR